ncbi:MAG: acyloxyacyl hydrolase [Polaribacter sp.]
MKKRILFFLIFSLAINFFSQEKERLKSQPSKFLSKSYYSINFGAIFYPFTNDNLIAGYKTESFSRNFFSGRMLLGHKITPSLGIQFGTMRPAAWFKYDNINNIGYDRSVWINVWSLSLKKNFSLNNKFSLYAEAGIANVTRIGFKINDIPVYPSAHFGSIIYGFGTNYKLSDKWRLSLNATFVPEAKKYNQPAISQISAGFEYHIQSLPEELALAYSENKKYFFPNNILQISYGTSKIGFGLNEFFSANLKVGNFESFGLPVFWLGEVKAKNTFSVTYQRLLYRSERIFSLDWGVNVTAFNTEVSNDYIYAFSIFPTLRFYLLRKPGFDFYTNYSILGPTYLTKSNIDGSITGPKATFIDTMGFGVFFGKKRKYNFELKIMHYSNGNIFTENAGVAVPIQFTLGKTF